MHVSNLRFEKRFGRSLWAIHGRSRAAGLRVRARTRTSWGKVALRADKNHQLDDVLQDGAICGGVRDRNRNQQKIVSFILQIHTNPDIEF